VSAAWRWGGHVKKARVASSDGATSAALESDAIIDPARPPLAKAVRRARVMVIDDEALVGRVVRRVLAACDVVLETDGRAALARIAAKECFDVILCDLQMPRMTGAEVHAAVRALDPAAASRIIFLTGDRHSPGAEDFLAPLPNAVLMKPFDLDVLRELVTRVSCRD
jgi:CheY-like chemotaxis protein